MNENKDIAAVEHIAAGDVHCRELGRVARAVAAIPCVDGVWPDREWPKTFFASVHPEGADL